MLAVYDRHTLHSTNSSLVLSQQQCEARVHASNVCGDTVVCNCCLQSIVEWLLTILEEAQLTLLNILLDRIVGLLRRDFKLGPGAVRSEQAAYAIGRRMSKQHMHRAPQQYQHHCTGICASVLLISCVCAVLTPAGFRR